MIRPYVKLILLSVIFVIGIIFLILPRYNIFARPNCAAIPNTAPPAAKTSSIEIMSPPNGVEVDTIGILSINIQIQNFELKRDGNKIGVWVDGKPFEAFPSSAVIGIQAVALQNAGISRDGLHDVCIALIDGKTGNEVSERAGIQVLWRFHGPDEIDFSWLVRGLGELCLLSLLIIAGVFIISRPEPKPKSPNG